MKERTVPSNANGYVIIRLWALDASRCTPRLGVEAYVKKVLLDADEADREAKRLNDLNGPKGCLYFVQAKPLWNLFPELFSKEQTIHVKVVEELRGRPRPIPPDPGGST